MYISRYLLPFMVGTLSFTTLTAAPFTDTGSIYNQIKQNAQRGIKNKQHPKYKTVEKSQSILRGDHTVLVNGFKLIGNDEFSKAEIKKVLGAVYRSRNDHR